MKTLITFLFALLCATPAWAQPRPQPLPDARGLLRALEDAFTAVADRVTPAVVNVSTVPRRAGGAPGAPGEEAPERFR